MKEFKLIVAGGRDFNNYAQLSRVITDLATSKDMYGDRDVSIVSGMARGADALAVRFAKEHGIQLHEFHADWDRLGKGAGFARNADMGRFADGLLAFWDGKSRGTAHMIEFIRKINKPVHIINY